MKLTKSTLKKLEQVLESLGFDIIYGKGQFQSGHCLVEHEKKLVINKFYDIEARINILVEIINQQDWETVVDNQDLRTFILQNATMKR